MIDTNNVLNKDYVEGYIDGLTAFAWWKDGIQYVGSCGTTLESAIKDIRDRHEACMRDRSKCYRRNILPA